MTGIPTILAGCSLFVLMCSFLPTSESAPQNGNLLESLPKNDDCFIACLTGECGPECTPQSTECQCVPLSRCLDERPTTDGPITPPGPATDNGAPNLVNLDGVGIRSGPNQEGEPTDRSNVIIDIGDRTISLQCGDILSVCCDNIKKEETTSIPPPEPLNHQCGRRNTNGVGVTITGFNDGQAQLSEFPWMVAVLGKDNTYVGGGSLVDARVILTAAHKVQDYDASNLVARIGDWDLSAESEPIPAQNINVQKVLFHPEFNKGTLVNDVALLILETDATLGDTVMPVCLPEIDQEFDGSSCFVTGWGKDVFGKQGNYQKIMKKVSVPAVSHTQCQNMLRNSNRLGPTFNLHNTFNCAGGQGEDACEGDGGSPLVCPNPNNNGQYIQMGVVAWGIGCGQVGSPGVYGSIPKTVKWIRETIPKEVGFQIRTGGQDNGGGRGK